MKLGKYETHPAADAFPLLEGPAFTRFVDDVKRHGQIEDAWRDKDGLVLDGRNRVRACNDLGIEPRFLTYEGDDPIGFVVSMNIARRHLGDFERAAVACKLASLPNHRPKKGARVRSLTQAQAAEALDTSERSIQLVKATMRDGDPAIVEAGMRGDISITAAAELAALPQDEQKPALEKVLAGGENKKQRGATLRNVRASNDNEPEVDAVLVLLRAIAREVERMGGRIRSRSENKMVVILHGQELELELERKAAA